MLAFAVAMQLWLAGLLGQVFATPVDFSTYTLPFEPDDIFESGLSFAGLFGALILITISLRYAPKIVSSIKRMAR